MGRKNNTPPTRNLYSLFARDCGYANPKINFQKRIMKLLYRLGYYLAGFSVGLIFLAFIFSGKKTSCNYGPSARVKNDLLQKTIQISSDLQSRYPQLKDSTLRAFIEKGSIDFSKSKTKLDSCRIYFIELEEETSSFLEVANFKKQVKVLNLQRP